MPFLRSSLFLLSLNFLFLPFVFAQSSQGRSVVQLIPEKNTFSLEEKETKGISDSSPLYETWKNLTASQKKRSRARLTLFLNILHGLVFNVRSPRDRLYLNLCGPQGLCNTQDACAAHPAIWALCLLVCRSTHDFNITPCEESGRVWQIFGSFFDQSEERDKFLIDYVSSWLGEKNEKDTYAHEKVCLLPKSEKGKSLLKNVFWKSIQEACSR